MAVDYPLNLRTFVRAQKSRSQPAAFSMSDPRRGYAYVQPTGTDVPVIWDVGFRFTTSEAQAFRLWFIFVLQRGLQEFNIPISTEFGVQTYTVRFLDANLLDLREDGASWVYSAKVMARKELIPSALSSLYVPSFSGTIPSQSLTLGIAYTFSVASYFGGGAVGTLTFSVASGTLPDGITLDSATGILSGTPTTTQTLTGISITGSVAGAGSATSNTFTMQVYPSGFLTWLYSGSGGSSLAIAAPSMSNGGVVWTHASSASQSPDVYLSANGTTIYRQQFDATTALVQPADMTMSGSGYTLTSSRNNVSSRSYAAWSFARLPRFVDVVSYVGDGSSSKAIAHSLGIKPGLYFVVDTTGTDTAWYYYDRINGAGKYRQHASTTTFTDATVWAATEPTATQFYVGNSAKSNVSGRTYLAILFAHDTAADGVIQCATYTGNGSTTGPTVTLGWQPQFVWFIPIQNAAGTNPAIADTARTPGFTGNEERAYSFLSVTPDSGWSDAIALVTNGFQLKSISVDCNGNTVVYLAVCVRA
jgi:hypothetical protein